MTTPPTWPPTVKPPTEPRWGTSAITWLWTLVPPIYANHQLLTDHPLLLARQARLEIEASLAAVRRGAATARVDLMGLYPQDVLEATMALYAQETARLEALEEQVREVTAALERGIPRAGR